MSYDVDLLDDDGEVVNIETPHTEGGTHTIGGDSRATLNITYNYSDYYYNLLDEDDGLWAIDGDRAEEWIETFEQAVDELGTEQDGDYWAETPGNAGYALNVLLKWMRENPDARFSVV